MERADLERPWYETAFEDPYLEVYAHRDLASARVEVEGLLARGLWDVRGRLLDLGCGFGRHLLALREHGFDAVGLDRSPGLLARAATLGDGALRGRLVRGDFRNLPFHARSFEALLMLFSSFGYFSDEENARVLGEIGRILRPRGLAVFDLMNPSRVRAQLVPETRTERGGFEIIERRRLQDRDRRVVKDVRLHASDGSERSWTEDVRLYETAELGEMLAAAGLTLVRVDGDFDEVPLDPASPRMIVWANRGP